MVWQTAHEQQVAESTTVDKQREREIGHWIVTFMCANMDGVEHSTIPYRILKVVR
jgi:hypothetical protein